MTTSPRRATPAGRATRRSRRPAPRSTTFLERNRTRLLWAGGAVVIAVLAGIAFINSTQPVYACTNVFDPTPAPGPAGASAAPTGSGTSPAPATTEQPPGYVQEDMGHLHVNPGTRVRYTWCPPASGRHYNASGEGPIRPGVYGPGDRAVPPGWVHNLEHGALVVLYSCVGDACTDQGQQALEALFAQLPPSPICQIPAGSLDVIARFDDMPWPYAALVWDVVLPLQTLDTAAILDFYAQRGDRFNPEKPASCTQASPSPGPASPAPAASPGASPAPAASPLASPALSPSEPASPAATPAAS